MNKTKLSMNAVLAVLTAQRAALTICVVTISVRLFDGVIKDLIVVGNSIITFEKNSLSSLLCKINFMFSTADSPYLFLFVLQKSPCFSNLYKNKWIIKVQSTKW